MNKKIWLVLTLVIVLVSIPLGYFLFSKSQELRIKAAPESVLFFDPATVNVAEGETFSLTSMINTNNNVVTGVDAYVKFNPQALQLVSFNPGSSLSLVDASVFPIVNNQEGFVFFSVYNLAGVSGNQVLGYLTFSVAGGDASNQLVVYTDSPDGSYQTLVSAKNEVGVDVLAEVQSTTVVIGAGGELPTETPVPTATDSPVLPTETPVPTSTSTPLVPTSTPTTGSLPVGGSTANTPTPTRTPTRTPTPIPTTAVTYTGGGVATSTPVPTATTAPVVVSGEEEEIPVTGVAAPTIIGLGVGFLLIIVAFGLIFI